MFFKKEDQVKAKIITLSGEPGFGKSFLGMFFAMRYNEARRKKNNIKENDLKHHPRIFGNSDILWKGKNIIKKITYENLSKIPFSKTPGLLLFDESFQNAGSRDSLTKENKNVVNELGSLARKKNLYVIFMAQINRMFDVMIRELSYISIELNEPFYDFEEYGDYRLIFSADIYKKGNYQNNFKFNLFELFIMGYKFNTIDISKMKKQNRNIYKEQKEEYKNKIKNEIYI